jgi:hypothetical protein
MRPMDLIRRAARPLGVHTVATPELVPEGPDVTEVDVKESELQYIAELSGDEMDEFTQVWFAIREKYLSEIEAVQHDYRRVAVAFSWCDVDRNRFNEDMRSVWEVAQALAEKPATLTTRMFAVANGANAFSGIDDETKKNSRVQSQGATNADGSGE